jgi:hypothetical protein
MPPTTCWGLSMGLLLLCHLGTLPPSLGAAEPSPEYLVVAAFCQAIPYNCPQGAAQTTVDDLRTLDGPMLRLAASVPPEDPLASDCRYVGFQMEWIASKRDVGLPLGEALLVARRVFALDRPWPYALYGVMGTLVYRAPPQSCARPWKPNASRIRCSGRSTTLPGRRGEMWRCVATGVQHEDHATESLDTKPARMGAVGACFHGYRLAPGAYHGEGCLTVGAAMARVRDGACPMSPSALWVTVQFDTPVARVVTLRSLAASPR